MRNNDFIHGIADYTKSLALNPDYSEAFKEIVDFLVDDSDGDICVSVETKSGSQRPVVKYDFLGYWKENPFFLFSSLSLHQDKAEISEKSNLADRSPAISIWV